jgi:hypothetical protein
MVFHILYAKSPIPYNPYIQRAEEELCRKGLELPYSSRVRLGCGLGRKL